MLADDGEDDLGEQIICELWTEAAAKRIGSLLVILPHTGMLLSSLLLAELACLDIVQ